MACLSSSVARRLRLGRRGDLVSRPANTGGASQWSGAVPTSSSVKAVDVHGWPARHHGTPSATWFAHGRPVVVKANPQVLIVITSPAPDREPSSHGGAHFSCVGVGIPDAFLHPGRHNP
jgi:hypothetical protein